MLLLASSLCCKIYLPTDDCLETHLKRKNVLNLTCHNVEDLLFRRCFIFSFLHGSPPNIGSGSLCHEGRVKQEAHEEEEKV